MFHDENYTIQNKKGKRSQIETKMKYITASEAAGTIEASATSTSTIKLIQE